MDLTRRDFVKSTLAAGGALYVGGAAPELAFGAERLKEPVPLAKARQEARKRRRRIIYNNDGAEPMESGVNTPEEFLARRMQAVPGTQVDSVFYSPGSTTIFTHLAKVGETYGQNGTPAWNHAKVNIEALRKGGHDTLAMVTDFCHEHKVEIVFSHRINDIHDSFMPEDLSLWKRKHPDYCLGTKADLKYPADSPKHWWSALDFEKPQVRDYLFGILEDVCKRYDVDGIEVDYFRSPMFFHTTMNDKPTTPAQIKIMTGFQRRICEMAYREGTRRGRPILVVPRVPMTVELCKYVGIDIVAWLEEGLADLLTTGGGYIPWTMPTAELSDVGHKHGIQVYPSISRSGMRQAGSIEGWRGAASNAGAAGADGIYLFNHFPKEPSQQFKELGSAETLAGRDKIFIIDRVYISEGDLRPGIAQAHILPKPIPADGKPLVLNLPIGDDLPAAAAEGKLASAEMSVQIAEPAGAESVAVKLNGRALKPARTDAKAGSLTFQLDGKACRKGPNELTLSAPGRQAEAKPLRAMAVELHVKYT